MPETARPATRSTTRELHGPQTPPRQSGHDAPASSSPPTTKITLVHSRKVRRPQRSASCAAVARASRRGSRSRRRRSTSSRRPDCPSATRRSQTSPPGCPSPSAADRLRRRRHLAARRRPTAREEDEHARPHQRPAPAALHDHRVLEFGRVEKARSRLSSEVDAVPPRHARREAERRNVREVGERRRARAARVASRRSGA